MPYAEVSVNSPIAHRQLFSYSIPDGFNIEIGQAVWVPFGSKVLQGIVLQLSHHPSVEQTRDIIGVMGEKPLLSPHSIALAQWLSDYYLCPVFDALSPLLPPAFERKILTSVSVTAAADNLDLENFTPPQRQVMELLKKNESLDLRRLEKMLGKKKGQAAVSQLVARNLISRSHHIQPPRVKPKQVDFVSLAADKTEALQAAAGLRKKMAFRQAALLELLAQSASLPAAEARKQSGCQAATIKTLADKGLVKVWTEEIKRQSIDYSKIETTSPLKLTASQQNALNAIEESLRRGKAATFLLHGITGSGKTEVYLQALATVLKMGRQAIVLVPEISLTPQAIERFAGRFPHRVAVLHSRLSLGEQFDQWRQIEEGRFDVVVGPRSALFAPLPDPGLIIIDEEHEWSYKQDTSPRYHARKVALKLAELNNATVVLGSATPDVESFYNAQRGNYRLLVLPSRIISCQDSALPEVEIVDMKDELKAGNRGIFSRSLKTAIEAAINSRQQVILFFNRRGAATLIQCRSCGYVMQCRRCHASLNYHSAENSLVCHHCNFKTAVPGVCPQCHSQRLKFTGGGTQKLEQETALIFPKARILRWDSDATRNKHSHQEILDAFRQHKADILIGTQMVAKGLDLQLVTLVGVVSADSGLNLPDFRAGERVFQLLTQVAGRAGRGAMGGRVIIQTFFPQHYSIQAALRHDYVSFYRQEIAYRRQLHNPPFSRIIRLTYSHINEAACHKQADELKRLLAIEMDAGGIGGISLIGPAPAFVPRLRGRYRWQLILRGKDLAALLSRIDIPQGWAVDVDPLGLD